VRRVPATAWFGHGGVAIIEGVEMERVGLGRRAYQAPLLTELGSFSELTLGMGGSAPDGGSRGATQVGGMGQAGVSGAANGRR
jgi:hypothetical protein